MASAVRSISSFETKKVEFGKSVDRFLREVIDSRLKPLLLKGLEGEKRGIPVKLSYNSSNKVISLAFHSEQQR
jgi:hypothetical protein